MAIYPKPSHTLYNVLTNKTKWPYCLYHCIEPILVFSFFFSKLEHLITIFLATSTIMSAIWLHHLECTNLSHVSLREKGYYTKVSSVIQNQTRAFSTLLRLGQWKLKPPNIYLCLRACFHHSIFSKCELALVGLITLHPSPSLAHHLRVDLT